MKKYLILFIFALSTFIISCSKDDLEPTVAQNKDVETGISTIDDLQGVLCGAYNRMTQFPYYGRDMIVYGELRSDNMYANGSSGRFLTTAGMNMTTQDANPDQTWLQIYATIASANVVISKKDVSFPGDATEQVRKKNIVGQAYAIRALCHYDLLRLFGQQHVTNGNNLGVPYVSEFKGSNALPTRNTVDEVKAAIYQDLTTALTYLDPTFSDAKKQFISVYAVAAIRARVAIYFGDWSTAKTACETIINSNEFQIVSQANYVASWSQKGPVNSIFELAFSSTDQLGNTGIQFIYRGAAYGDVRVLDNIRTIFDAGDVRNSNEMINYDPAAPAYLTCMGKYPSANYSDDIFLCRYEEVILNYAEALYELNNTDPNALTTLNLIPAQRGANPYATISKDNILLERRKELCFEGFRFDDLARTHKNMPLVDAVKQTFDRPDAPVYGAYNYAFPIPQNEINANANCVQNYGY